MFVAKSSVSSTSAASSVAEAPCRLPRWAYVLGLCGILIALVASGALVWQHLTGKSLPGCGGVKSDLVGTSLTMAEAPKSACGSLEAHPLGSLGGVKAWVEATMSGQKLERVSPRQAFWPVSFIGATYFAAALAAWLVIGARGRRIGRVVRWVIRLGALASVGYLVVIVVSSKFCQYCIASHAGNLLLLASVEIGVRKSRSGSVSKKMNDRGWTAAAVGAAVFLMVSGALGVLESNRLEAVQAEAKREFDQAQAQIAAKIQADKTAAASQPKEDPMPWGPGGFTGRWRLGPAKAPVRIVMFFSYQCPDCKLFEAEALNLVEKHKDRVSLSVMHFPLCPDCNRHVVGANQHPNGCWAARAAEAGAMIAGSQAVLAGKDQHEAANEAFWKMHKWLFEKGGSFTSDELVAALPGLGFKDTDGFIKVMTGDGAVKPVAADIDIGHALGLYYTPMMFVNGVEVRGWLSNPKALTQAAEAALALNPPVAGPENDRPALAREKYIADWREEPVKTLPPARDGRTLGAPTSMTEVVVWGDYTEPNTKLLDTMMRDWASSKPIRYSFRHFPGAKACNPNLPKDFFPNGCVAARAAEAAGIVGGPDAFWKMHAFLFGNAQAVTPERVAAGAASIGLDPEKFTAAMNSPEVNTAISRDVQGGQAMGLRAIPTIYVDGKLVVRWSREGDNVMERIINESIAEKSEKEKGKE